MKILLVKARPARTHGMASPPLGLLYLSAALKAAGYTDVAVLDGSLCGEEEFYRLVERSGADLVGISAITAEGLSLHRAAAAAKRGNGRAFVAAGGHYPSSDPERCLRDPAVDAVVPGEGERAVVELARALVRGEAPRGLLAAAPFEEDLDSLPPPDWDAVDHRRYAAFVPQTPLLYGSRYLTLLTSRGCPYGCVFCHRLMGGAFRAHSPERVVSELAGLKARYGVDRFEIADDAFNFDRERAAEIFRRLAAAGLGVRLYLCGIRADLLDEELVGLMKAAGVVYAACGLETADFALQGAIGKRLDTARFAGNIRLLERAGIFTTAGVILGFEGETAGSLMRTARFLLASRLHTVMLATLRVYPGTPLAAGSGRALTPEDDLGAYADLSGDGLPAGRALRLGLAKAVLNAVFYLDPRRLYIIFRDLPERSPAVLRLLAGKFFSRTLLPR